ncbi:hypothetical protein F7725_015201 [Dissostichus mawsoni]|uniref:Uncharacterized protein n=1 Tax=Dissostichus mawsoni TaxID=36200 RepID=A0A7J5YGV0_DISMA|nr:hypothetical protein F7725_015201 [Dissostichus mawsoni]
MESPYKNADRHAANPDVAWNALGHQQRYRFSAPDIFSHRLPPQPLAADMPSEVIVPEQKRRTSVLLFGEEGQGVPKGFKRFSLEARSIAAQGVVPCSN